MRRYLSTFDWIFDRINWEISSMVVAMMAFWIFRWYYYFSLSKWCIEAMLSYKLHTWMEQCPWQEIHKIECSAVYTVYRCEHGCCTNTNENAISFHRKDKICCIDLVRHIELQLWLQYYILQRELLIMKWKVWNECMRYYAVIVCHAAVMHIQYTIYILFNNTKALA